MTAPLCDPHDDEGLGAVGPVWRFGAAFALVVLLFVLALILATTDISTVPPVTGPVVTPQPYAPPSWPAG
jgi:hypothetical protein